MKTNSSNNRQGDSDKLPHQGQLAHLGMMVSSMCQYDWVLRWPHISQTLFLHVSVKVFLDKVNLRISRLSKADGWVSSKPVDP